MCGSVQHWLSVGTRELLNLLPEEVNMRVALKIVCSNISSGEMMSKEQVNCCKC